METDEIKFVFDNGSLSRIEKKKNDESDNSILNYYFRRPNLMNIYDYYLYWRIQLYLLMDRAFLDEIGEFGIDEEELLDRYGITTDEFVKPNLFVIRKVNNYLSTTKNQIIHKLD